MFHLANGETTATALAARFPGLVHSWGDMLMDGPAPQGFDDAAGWARRAGRLQEEFGIPSSDLLARRDADRRAVASLGTYDESVLWFEEDLFCQANLAFLLAALGDKVPDRVTIVCPDEALGSDRARLAALFSEREPLTPERVRLAGAAWRALASPDPRAVERVVDRADFTSWPRLARGLALHLARFPSTRDGLDVVSRATLNVLAGGPATFPDLFCRTMAGLPALGMGDMQFAVEVAALTRKPFPLVEARGDALVIADAGRRALAGNIDVVRDRGIDRWLGGVHILGNDPAWRWDADARRLVAT